MKREVCAPKAPSGFSDVVDHVSNFEIVKHKIWLSIMPSTGLIVQEPREQGEPLIWHEALPLLLWPFLLIP